MMGMLKWAALAVVALFVWSWLRNGSLGASMQAQAYPNTWGSGMLYARGSSWMGSSYPSGYPYPVPGGYRPATPIFASYSPDNGVTFAYGGL